jgi:hypothetical protein
MRHNVDGSRLRLCDALSANRGWKPADNAYYFNKLSSGICIFTAYCGATGPNFVPIRL